jgi:hypothetical protein
VAQHSMQLSENREFIASDRWKCGKSPGGAHYWMIQNYLMTCRYCNNSKEIKKDSVGWTKTEVKTVVK